MTASWVEEGVSTRTRFGHPSPVVHLIVDGRLWCTGSPGRKASIHHLAVTGYPPPKVCKVCRQLAADAIDDETLDAADAGRFAPNQQITKEARS